MITTNSEKLYLRLKRLRSHGMVYQSESYLLQQNHGGWYMEMQELGYNYRIPDILCALGISQLKRAKEGIQRRRQIAKKYYSAFEGSQIRTYEPPVDVAHAYHLFIVNVKNRKEVYDKLREHKIYAQIHYVPVHMMPYYMEIKEFSLPKAEAYYEHCLSLPMYPTLTDAEQGFVIEKVLEYAK